jgi:hypothetical protein
LNFQFDTRFAKSRYKFSFIRGAPQAHGVSYLISSSALLLAAKLKRGDMQLSIKNEFAQHVPANDHRAISS